MAQLCQVIRFSREEANLHLIEKAKEEINGGKSGGPQIQGKSSVAYEVKDGQVEAAIITFERAGK